MNVNQIVEQPLISIITVVLNGHKYIEDTLQSVTNQSYANIEYIIIDGGSNDGTQDIIRRYEDKISYWISEKDAGLYYAMNKGINMASGEWINFMNAGDFFFDINTISNIATELNTDLVYGDYARYQKDKNAYQVINSLKQNDRWNIPFCHQSLFSRREILRRYPFNTDYKIAADYNQYLTFKKANIPSKHVPLVVSCYLEDGISAVSKNIWIKEHRHIHRKHFWLSADLLYFLRLCKLKLTGK
ncbi:glycosyltransferase family 2 protein [Thiothrix lacustris]|uniref:glycosyltransferase family 2 protein n=1 Tax=Thiothrix lacustris TaxID=525917 RepID=UPI0027E49C62|nr:glycosyltransferase family 2 protein [Thiothrix lacustris]WMP18893.1 glycosyltransferase family 2 protein [Thiothrix lacustris]